MLPNQNVCLVPLFVFLVCFLFSTPGSLAIDMPDKTQKGATSWLHAQTTTLTSFSSWQSDRSEAAGPSGQCQEWVRQTRDFNRQQTSYKTNSCLLIHRRSSLWGSALHLCGEAFGLGDMQTQVVGDGRDLGMINWWCSVLVDLSVFLVVLVDQDALSQFKVCFCLCWFFFFFK